MKWHSWIVLPVLAWAFGCSVDNGFQNADRANRLMRMAGDEAAGIKAPGDRLARQLNVAQLEIDDRRPADARHTLASATRTLESIPPADLDAHTRLAGWVSISELSRRADDHSAAESATNTAIRLLETTEPATERVRYVRGVAEEIHQLRGIEAAAALLRRGGPWAGQIKDESGRRAALTGIASDLFALDDYEGGRQVLREDRDAAWRTDTLTQLASSAEPVPMSGAYSQSLSYEAVFSPAARAAGAK